MKARRKHLFVVVIALFLLSAGSIFAAMNAMVPLPVAAKKTPDANDFHACGGHRVMKTVEH